MTAPPVKLKNDKKKLVAVKAIERPKTILIRLRIPPPASPKASPIPVMIMAIVPTGDEPNYALSLVRRQCFIRIEPVSYTHLTLPTIYSV